MTTEENSSNTTAATNVVPIDVDVDTAENKKKKKLTSKVWNDFCKRKDSNGNDKAICNHCKKTFVGSSKVGTTHLASHLQRCTAKIYKDSGQKTVMDMMNSDGTPKVAFKFDQHRSRMDLARMIIKYNYSFSMADHEFFEYFCNGLNPDFKLITRNTVRADIIKLHEEMKGKVKEMVDGLDCRVTLTTNIWTSDTQNFAYACLTAHYIEKEWLLKKKILNYKMIAWPYDGESLFKFISQLVVDWNLDKKLFSMVVDNASSNDSMTRYLKGWLADEISCAGDFFHIRCSAHILNLIVQDGLAMIRPLLNNIRGTVSVAIEYEDVFDRLECMDKNYELNPSKEEWKVARIVHGCLKLFSDATVHFSGSDYPTANVFFPDICEIKVQLSQWEHSSEACLRLMAGPMRIKFSKYWDECSLCLAIAVILDPRFKMDIIEYYYDKLYGREYSYVHVGKVRTAFFNLYIEYGGRVVSSQSSIVDMGIEDLTSSSVAAGTTPSQNSKLNDFKKWKLREQFVGNKYVPKSEFDQYLEEETHPTTGNFNILTWWSVNSSRFPTISKIERDVLAVPATTVASESTFSTGGRVLDESRSCLLPDVIEALITTADWIPSRKKIISDRFPNERADAGEMSSCRERPPLYPNSTKV